MKFRNMVAASLLALATVPVAVHAQDAPDLTVGTMVYDGDGNEVGTIEQLSGDNVIINTGTNLGALAKASFGQGEKGPIVGITKVEFDAALNKAKEEAAAKLATALVPGATVYGIQGTPVGTVNQVLDNGQVVLTHEVGDVPLPRDQFTTTDKGLSLKFTAEQLDAALAPLREMKAKVQAALVAGASLVTTDGAPAGTVRELNENGEAVIDYAETAFAMPPNQFIIDGQGRLALNLSKAQLNSALGVSGS
jgi:hypothetical protein